jgi:hypothetical protein
MTSAASRVVLFVRREVTLSRGMIAYIRIKQSDRMMGIVNNSITAVFRVSCVVSVSLRRN